MGPGTPLWTMKLATTLSKEEKRFRKAFHGISRVTMSARQHYSACAKHCRVEDHEAHEVYFSYPHQY